MDEMLFGSFDIQFSLSFYDLLICKYGVKYNKNTNKNKKNILKHI